MNRTILMTLLALSAPLVAMDDSNNPFNLPNGYNTKSELHPLSPDQIEHDKIPTTAAEITTQEIGVTILPWEEICIQATPLQRSILLAVNLFAPSQDPEAEIKATKYLLAVALERLSASWEEGKPICSINFKEKIKCPLYTKFMFFLGEQSIDINGYTHTQCQAEMEQNPTQFSGACSGESCTPQSDDSYNPGNNS